MRCALVAAPGAGCPFLGWSIGAGRLRQTRSDRMPAKRAPRPRSWFAARRRGTRPKSCRFPSASRRIRGKAGAVRGRGGADYPAPEAGPRESGGRRGQVVLGLPIPELVRGKAEAGPGPSGADSPSSGRVRGETGQDEMRRGAGKRTNRVRRGAREGRAVRQLPAVPERRRTGPMPWKRYRGSRRRKRTGGNRSGAPTFVPPCSPPYRRSRGRPAPDAGRKGRGTRERRGRPRKTARRARQGMTSHDLRAESNGLARQGKAAAVPGKKAGGNTA
jgi:hypothetical protein